MPKLNLASWNKNKIFNFSGILKIILKMLNNEIIFLDRTLFFTDTGENCYETIISSISGKFKENSHSSKLCIENC